jgi:plastocyanin
MLSSPPARLLAACFLLLAVLGATAPPIVVSQKNKTFSRSEIRLRVGDSVTFTNNDDVSHNVFSSSDGLKFNLKRQQPGSSLSVAFRTRGTAEVRCAFHPAMKLVVVVE